MNLVENTPLFHGSYKIVSDPQVDYESNDLEKIEGNFVTVILKIMNLKILKHQILERDFI